MVENKLRKICINYSSCYDSKDLISIEDIVLENIETDKKSYKDIVNYYVGYKTERGIKPLYSAFPLVTGCIRDGDDE